jgi:hypothetical protein
LKKLIVITAMLVVVSPLAKAKNVSLKDEVARAFIHKHFPDAYIPGEVEGNFTYISKNGKKKHGYAKCDYPAMGAASEGSVPICSVKY